MDADPHEWKNLANNDEFAQIIVDHRKWLPTTNAPPAPGSKHRILTLRDGNVNWEGENVSNDDPVPEL